MGLDQMIWDLDHPGPPTPQIKQALRQYGKRCVYVSLHDWQREPPALTLERRSQIDRFSGWREISAVPVVAAQLPNLLDVGPETSMEGWLLCTLRHADSPEPVAFSFSTVWDFDPLIAFYQYFWADPSERSHNPNQDGVGLLSLFLEHLHCMAKEDFIAVLAPMDNPVLRLLATSRFPILDALDIRLTDERPSDDVSS